MKKGNCARGMFMAVAMTAAASGVLLSAGEARADSGRLNLHVNLGAALPPYGVGGDLALDWQFRPPFALEGTLGGGHLFNAVGNEGLTFFHAGLGARFRLLDDQAGYANEPGGNLAGNFWIAPHLGVLMGLFPSVLGGGTSFGAAFAVDVAVGYQFSVFRPISLGVFARGMLGINGNGVAPIITAGLNASFELIRIQDEDSDHDGLMNRAETSQWNTDPNNPDTDGDGINDGIEVRTNTNPRSPDSDRDSLTDGQEDANRNGTLDDGESDPRVADSDHGGSSDGWESQNHRNLRDPADDDNDHDRVMDERDQCQGTPPNTEVDERGCAVIRQELVLEGIRFGFDSANIEPESESVLNGAAEILRENPTVRVEVGGHTDDIGNAAHNQQLSQARAQSVFDWLVAHGIDAARMTVRGYGPTRPRVPNNSDENRAQNRRIEFRRIE